MLDCALDADASVEAVYVGAGALGTSGVRESVERAMSAGARAFELAPGVLEKIAGTVTPQPVLAVVRTPESSLEDVADADLVIVCVDVRDPGNAGALIRSADAVGCRRGRVLRRNGGPLQPEDCQSFCGVGAPRARRHGSRSYRGSFLARRRRDFCLRGAVAHGGTPHTDVDWSLRSALVLGNEATGLSESVRPQLGELVTVSMSGQAESLNVAIAGAVICFEALRQRSTLSAVNGHGPGRHENLLKK